MYASVGIFICIPICICKTEQEREQQTTVSARVASWHGPVPRSLSRRRRGPWNIFHQKCKISLLVSQLDAEAGDHGDDQLIMI